MTAPRMKGTFVVLAICYPDYAEIRLTDNLNRPHDVSIYSPQSTPISSRESQIRTVRCVRSPAMFNDLTVNPGPGSIDHLLHLSTTSTTIHCSTYFRSVDRISSTKMNMARLGGLGVANGGGISSCKFAEDGDTSYFPQPATLVFALFVHMARP